MITFIIGKGNKKYTAILPNGRRVSFGDKRYQQYYDKIGVYSWLNHYDKKRRALYRARHGTNPKKYSAGWFALKYLW